MSVFKQCISQIDASKPYFFKDTGINVYSFEEMLYHCFNFWEESIYDFINGGLARWVLNELKLADIAMLMENIRNSQVSLTEQFTKLLLISDYYVKSDLENIINKLLVWENKTQWEKLKEKGDYCIKTGNYEKAAAIYNEALNYVDEPSLYNNLAIAYTHMDNHRDAEKFFFKALEKTPNDIKIYFNLIKLYKIQQQFSKALKMLKTIKDKKNPQIQIEYGDIEMLMGNTEKAINHYRKAIKLGNTEESYIKLSEVYISLNDILNAKKILELVPNKNTTDYLMQVSKLNEVSGNTEASIQKTLQALTNDKENVNLWMNLARLYLKSADTQNASFAVKKAQNLDPENENASLVSAKIKRVQGKINEYQSELNNILNKWKEKYRQKI